MRAIRHRFTQARGIRVPAPFSPSLPVQMAPDWPKRDALNLPDLGRYADRDPISGLYKGLRWVAPSLLDHPLALA